MKHRVLPYLFIQIVISIFLLCCGNDNRLHNISEAKAIRISYATINKNGYDLKRYSLDKAVYIHELNEWWVHFDHVPPAPVGGDFTIRVDDRTGTAVLDVGD